MLATLFKLPVFFVIIPQAERELQGPLCISEALVQQGVFIPWSRDQVCVILTVMPRSSISPPVQFEISAWQSGCESDILEGQNAHIESRESKKSVPCESLGYFWSFISQFWTHLSLEE